jgi:hypothetical protein
MKDGEGKENNLKKSVTWLHLLRHTPFFTGLDKQQLRWVIDHSSEWEVQAGTVVAKVGTGQPLTEDIWILLDGRWQVEVEGRAFPSGHADSGKWYSAVDVGSSSRLITTEKSYVMRIERRDMQQMLNQGFAFNTHLKAGMDFYAGLFAQAGSRRSINVAPTAPSRTFPDTVLVEPQAPQ